MRCAADTGAGRGSRRRQWRCSSMALLLCRVFCAPEARAAQRSGSSCASCLSNDPPGATGIDLSPRNILRTHVAGTRAAAAGTLLVRGGTSEVPVSDGGGAAEGAAGLRSLTRTKKQRMNPVEKARHVADVRDIRDSGRLRATCLNAASATLALCVSVMSSVLATLMRLGKPVLMVYGLVSGLVYRTLRALTHGVGDVVSLYVDGMVAFQDAGACGLGQRAAAALCVVAHQKSLVETPNARL